MMPCLVAQRNLASPSTHICCEVSFQPVATLLLTSVNLTCPQAIQGHHSHTVLQDLSSRFYQVIPHSFGRQRPPVISSLEAVKTKLDMCNMLGDIEYALNPKS